MIRNRRHHVPATTGRRPLDTIEHDTTENHAMHYDETDHHHQTYEEDER